MLYRDLNSIITRLGRIDDQKQPLLIIFQTLNEQKVGECLRCLEGSLGEFQVRRIVNAFLRNQCLTNWQLSHQIGVAHSLEDIKTSIMQFHSGVNNITETVGEIRTDVKKLMKTLLQKPESSSDRPNLPSGPTIFYGRDPLVAETIEALTQPQRKHFALIGQGGIGKTATARAILHEQRIKDRFTTQHDAILSDRRFWVPCVGANTVEKLEHSLLKGIAGTQDSSSARQTVFARLKMLRGPILIVLDNFEDPWDTDELEGRSEVQNILLSLDSIPDLSILMTIRAAEPPCDELPWIYNHLNPIDNQSAKQVYREHGHGHVDSLEQDSAMMELLETVGHLPLAITLLAAAARKLRVSPNELLLRYKAQGTAMLGPSGKDQHHNMDRCVQVSVDRLTGQFRESSLQLLAMLAMLPAGATAKSFWLRELKDLDSSLMLLLDGALVQVQQAALDLQCYTVHPVIRDFILAKERCPKEALMELLNRACRFLDQNEYEVGQATFRERASIIHAEETNLLAVLLTTDGDSTLIKALIVLAKHHSATSPQLAAAQKAAALARLNDDMLQEAEAHFYWGKNLHALDRFGDAQDQFAAARELFSNIAAPGSSSRAADCLLETAVELIYFTTGEHDRKKAIINEALLEYESIRDERGTGRCLREQAVVLWQHGEWDIALVEIQRACDQLQNHPYDRGLCYQRRSRICFDLENYEEGEESGQRAIELLNQFGTAAEEAHVFSWALGTGHIQFGRYESALPYLYRAIDLFMESSRSLDLAQNWGLASFALLKMGDVDLAAEALDKLSMYLSVIPDGDLKQSCCGWWDMSTQLLNDAHMRQMISYEEWRFGAYWYWKAGDDEDEDEDKDEDELDSVSESAREI